MSIPVNCACGKALNVKDELGGKKIKCPACAAVLAVPAPAEEIVEDFDYEDEAPAKPAPRAKAAPKAEEKSPFAFDERKKKKKKSKRRVEEDESGLAAMYMADARRQAEKDERRVQGNDGGGLTILGITVTAGVLGGLGMILISAIGGLAALFIPEARTPRIMIGAGVLFVLGGFAIIHAIFGGEED
jgi:hypothetical protein